jgi:pyrophosphatase PpaX
MDTIVGCDGSTRHKPDPEPVQIALTRLGCPPGEAVFVGDSVHDIIAGNAAGVRTVAATWGAFKRSDLESASPSLYLDDVSALLGIVA